MTKTEYRKNYRALVARTVKMLREYEEAALKSKAFALEEETTPFGLPSNVLVAALMHAQHQWGPLTKGNKKQIENIYAMTYPPV
jgi:hypothetical protein